MLILVVVLVLDIAVIIKGDGYYPGYHSMNSNTDPYTRLYYTSSAKQYGSGYGAEADQYSSPSSSSLAFTDQDVAQEYTSRYNTGKSYASPYQHDNNYQQYNSQPSSQVSAYSNGMEEINPAAEEYPNYSHSEDYTLRGNDHNNYQPSMSFESSHKESSGGYYRDHDNSNIEVTNHNIEIPTHHNYPPAAPQTTINLNSEPIPLNQHIHVTKHIPVPIYNPIHVPVAKPYKIEIPHPIIVPVPKPYPIQIQIAQPVPVPTVKELTIPFEKVIPYPVEKKIPYTVEKHVPYKVEKYVAVQVPHSYPVKIPIIKTVIHKVKTYGKGYVRNLGWN